MTTTRGGENAPFLCRSPWPLARADHPHDTIEPFLWGLLPDNDTVLERWARRFGVSRRNVFALLSEVGEDCAGAVQFVPPTRVDEIAKETSTVQWLSHAEIARRLRALRDDLSAWRMVGDRGRFSLAGAQARTALQRRRERWVPGPRFFACREELVPSTRHVTAPSGAHVPCASSVAVIPRWGVPTGREPTTHILKPPIQELDGHVQNERLRLSLARSLGFPAARSYVGHFEDEVAIVIERYDRVSTGDWIRRIHQEDLCQALGRHPSLNYQSDGGHGPEDIVTILREHSSRPHDDIVTFVDALAFRWLIGGTDAHAKNYSLLLGESRVRLAPLYDLASVLPYPDVVPHRMRLAMKVGGKYRLRDIVLRHWQKQAVSLGLDEGDVTERVRSLAARVPSAMSQVIAQAGRDGVEHPIVDRLADAIVHRAHHCQRLLAG